MTAQPEVDDILAFWFGELDAHGLCNDAQRKRWFQSTPEQDRAMAQRFEPLVQAALAGDLQGCEDDRALIARVLLLDQFTRNIYRGTPAAFSGDAKAVALAKQAVDSGRDRQLPAIHRVFLYIPFEHSESLADQEQCLACFDQLLDDSDPATHDSIGDFRRYVVAHRNVIAQFGRFPHRNAILGRDSTPEELDHLKHHGGF